MHTFSGPALRRHRTARNVRREALALAVDRSAQTIQLYEIGKVDPPASVVARLADALDVDPGALFEVAS